MDFVIFAFLLDLILQILTLKIQMIFFFTVRNHSGGARDPAFPPERRDMNRLTVAEAQKLASPAPFALLSVKREDGKTNLMALSWWSFLSNHPPLLGVCLSKKGLSGSLIEKNGEFALSLVGPALKDSAFRCGCCSGRVVDKAEDFGIPLEDAQAARPIVSSAARSSNLQMMPRLAKRSMTGWFSSSSSSTESRYISIGVYSAQLPLNRLAMAVYLESGIGAYRL